MTASRLRNLLLGAIALAPAAAFADEPCPSPGAQTYEAPYPSETYAPTEYPTAQYPTATYPTYPTAQYPTAAYPTATYPVVANGYGYAYPTQAPPAIRIEHVRPRRGFVWVQGHYEWHRGAYVWVGGYWERDRPGHRYVSGRWERSGRHYRWVAPTWQAHGRYGRTYGSGHDESRHGRRIWIERDRRYYR